EHPLPQLRVELVEVNHVTGRSWNLAALEVVVAVFDRVHVDDEDQVPVMLGRFEEPTHGRGGGLVELERHGVSPVSYTAWLAIAVVVNSPGQPTDRSLVPGLNWGQNRHAPDGAAGTCSHMAGRASGSRAMRRSRTDPRRVSASRATCRSYTSVQTHNPPRCPPRG